VEFVNEPVSDFARRLRAAPGKNIWIMGGGGLIASFLDAGQIDEFNISVVPTFIGEGVPLIAPQRRTVALKLLSSEQVQDGVVRLQYRVERRG
jgi:dihydrofolate reductase